MTQRILDLLLVVALGAVVFLSSYDAHAGACIEMESSTSNRYIVYGETNGSVAGNCTWDGLPGYTPFNVLSNSEYNTLINMSQGVIITQAQFNSLLATSTEMVAASAAIATLQSQVATNTAAISSLNGSVPTLQSIFQMPLGTDIATAWGLGFVIPLSVYLASWGFGSLIGMFRTRPDEE